jgi:amidase
VEASDLEDVCTGTLLQAAALVGSGDLSPVALTRAVLDRIQTYDGTLHSYVTVTSASALEQAERAEREIAAGHYRGALHGIPIAVKDLIATRSVRTTCGSKIFADRIPDHDAAVIERLEGAGAILLGKLGMTEFALFGYHPDYAVPVNPWNAERWAGVSSSGSGVATAASLCFAALASDTGGSIRIPASACGVVGIKPTFGKVSRHGCQPLADTLDHIGPMTRSVGDAAVLLAAIEGRDERDPTTRSDPKVDYLDQLAAGVRGMRVGIDLYYISTGVDPEVAGAVLRAVDVLECLGAEVVEVDVTGITDASDYWLPRVAVDALMTHGKKLAERPDDYGPTFRSVLEYGRTVSATEYAEGVVTGQRVRGILDGVFSRVELLACPSTGSTALPIAAFPPQIVAPPEIVPPLIGFHAPFNFSGNPTLSVPCGFHSDGLPLSLQLVGRHADEPALIRAGHAYEEATDWHLRRPALDTEMKLRPPPQLES